MSSREAKLEQREMITEKIKELNESNSFIDSLDSLVKQMNDGNNKNVKRH